MNTITASIIPLFAGIAIGFAIYPDPALPDPIHSDVIPLEQALYDYSCGERADEEHLQRVIPHARDAVLLPKCDPAQRRTEAYLCGEIGNEERVQRRIFDDWDGADLPECDPAQWGAKPNDEGDGTLWRKLTITASVISLVAFIAIRGSKDVSRRTATPS
jgi:hypothetical protein